MSRRWYRHGTQVVFVEERAIHFPQYIRDDLAQDQQTNSSIALREYDLKI